MRGSAVTVTVGAPLVGGGAAATTIVTSSAPVRTPSVAAARKMYVPGTLAVAVVVLLPGLAITATPGPERWLHVTTSDAGAGRPSSVAVAARVMAAGSVTEASGPASTRGAVFGGGGAALTVIRTSSLSTNSPSLACSLNTYTPALGNVMADDASVGETMPAGAGPDTCCHSSVSVLPTGRPSSLTCPASVLPSGNVTERSGPASTVGVRLSSMGVGSPPPSAFTVIVTVSLPLSAPSLAVSRST